MSKLYTTQVELVKYNIEKFNIQKKVASKFRLKIQMFSSKNIKINTQRFYSYKIGQSCIIFKLKDIKLINNCKFLINVKSKDGTEQERAIYFEEIQLNDGLITL